MKLYDRPVGIEESLDTCIDRGRTDEWRKEADELKNVEVEIVI